MFVFAIFLLVSVFGSLKADDDICEQNPASICEPGLIQPTNKDKFAEFCEYAKGRSKCYVQFAKSCGDTDDSLRFRRKEYKFLSENCKAGTEFYNGIGDNIECVNTVTENIAPDECTKANEKKAAAFLTYIMDLDTREIKVAKKQDKTLDCLDFIYDLACHVAIFGQNCGPEARNALLDMGRNLNPRLTELCHRQVIADMTTLVLALESIEDDEDEDVTE